MKITFLFALALVASSKGGPLQGCIEMDVCSSIVFNHLSLAGVKDAVGELVNNATSMMLRNSEEMRVTTMNVKKLLTQSKFNEKDLENCHKEGDRLDQVVTKLEFAAESLSNDDAWQGEMARLRQEKDALVDETEALEAEMLALEKVSTLQKEELSNLTKIVHKPADCADLQVLGERQSGVHTIYPFGTETPVEVLCDLDSDGGAWTVFIKRQPQDEPLDLNGSWDDYKKGFGNKLTEFWMGNDLLHQMTSDYASMLRMDAEDFQGNQRFAEWDTFSVDDGDHKYQLTVEGYQSTSTLGDSISESNGTSFTTFDQDNDDKEEFNCATGGSIFPVLGDGGWWYSANCGSTRPTAPLMNSNFWNSAFYRNWDKQGTGTVSLANLSLKFRRSNYERLAGRATWYLGVCQ